jgi:hypothetical protein
VKLFGAAKRIIIFHNWAKMGCILWIIKDLGDISGAHTHAIPMDLCSCKATTIGSFYRI